MASLAGEALRVDRRVLAQPDLVGRGLVALFAEAAHRVHRRLVIDAAEHADQRSVESTTFTIGCVDSVR